MSLSICKSPKDQGRIAKNKAELKRKCLYNTLSRLVISAELKGMNEEDAIEVMFADRMAEYYDEDAPTIRTD